jgi:DNA-binding MarR family transcriptional regulator
LVCLTSIIDHEPTTTTSIARDVYLSPSTVVGILDRLESRGLVTRDRDDEDRRVVNIRATEKGRRLVREAPSVLQDNLSESLRHLPLLEQATIALSLEQVVNLMEAGHLEAAPILETDLAGNPASGNEDRDNPHENNEPSYGSGETESTSANGGRTKETKEMLINRSSTTDPKDPDIPASSTDDRERRKRRPPEKPPKPPIKPPKKPPKRPPDTPPEPPKEPPPKRPPEPPRKPPGKRGAGRPDETDPGRV